MPNANPGPNDRPDVAALARWLMTWLQPSGAIHGYHNHSVWGNHPATLGDRWCGHSTFAAPLLPALAEIVAARPEPAALDRLVAAIRFQCSSRQADGEFDHIGFQIGEQAKRGLVHTVVPAAALCEAVLVARSHLPTDLVDNVDRVVREVIRATEDVYGRGASERTVANQEYIRLAARLLHMQAFDHSEWDDRVRTDLDLLAKHFHVRGLPDARSVGSLRSMSDADAIEPAEYYGLMIKPLVLAAQRFDRKAYLDQAMGFARHVVRSSWTDHRGRRRVHRLWQRITGEWIKTREPMLIAGIGLTLDAIRELLQTRDDPECRDFLADMDRTYAQSQGPAGMFLAASGWSREQDVIPASAWHAHDLLYLTRRLGPPAPEELEPAAHADRRGLAVVLGYTDAWLETVDRWALSGMKNMSTLPIHARKDQPRFGYRLGRWVTGRDLDPDAIIDNPPVFFRAEDRVVHITGRDDLMILNASGLAYDGPGRCIEA